MKRDRLRLQEKWWLSLVFLAPAAGAADGPRPGLALEFESAASQAPARDARVSRLAALFVPAGSPPSAFLPAGPFRAVFEGHLEAELRDDFTFSLEGRGEAVLHLDGKPILEAKGEDLSKAAPAAAELRQGRNRITLVYRSPPSGDAFVRLYWSSVDFAREPVPARVLSHDGAGNRFLAERLLLRRGRALASERRCFGCHPGGDASLPDAPDLTGVGERLERDWLARWINDPRALRPDALMPRVFRSPDGEIDPRAADLAAFLAGSAAGTQARKDPAPPSPERIAAGRRSFRDLGCLACHTLGATVAAPGRRPLGGLAHRWKPGALREFLLSPQRRYPGIRMPDFKLAEEEAAELAAFLLSLPGPVPGPSPPVRAAVSRDPARGKKLLEESGCLACHPISGGATNRLRGPAIDEPSDRGCLAPDSARRSTAPDFGFSTEERAALAAFLKTRPAAAEEPAAEFAFREVEALRCRACHARDGQPDVLSGLGEELSALGTDTAPPTGGGADGAPRTLDQTRPDLTWTGEKLRPEWMAPFIAGLSREPIRPWLASRMPAFPSRGDALARGLAMEHGLAPLSTADSPADPQLRLLGRRLISGAGGFGCTSCHDLGTTLAQGAFEAKGINFTYTRERIRKEFFHRWMLSPARVAPETRMPRFADEEGRSPFPDLGGDASKQFEAIWHFLLAGREASLGE